MYVDSIKIENLRCFEDAELQLQHPQRTDNAAPDLKNINLLLGTNGAGKTTTLKAIALAVLSPIIAQSGFVPYHLVRKINSKNSTIEKARVSADIILHKQDVIKPELKLRTPEPLITEIIRKGDTEKVFYSVSLDRQLYFSKGSFWEKIFFENDSALLMVGYGASRAIVDAENYSESTRKLLRYQRVAGLFEPLIILRPLASWLPQFKNQGRKTQVIHLIDKLLPDDARFTGHYENGEYLFEFGKAKVPFGALSDGYRAYIGWIADLLYHICMGAPRGAKLVDNYGVVLVDEIDLHLHPEWQRTVISRISKTLPNLQFVFSTHSPIVAGSLHKENIFVMETDKSGASTVHQYEERIYGLDAEQVLLSSYFNLPTTRAPGFVDELQSLSKKAKMDDPSAALALMQKLAGNPSDNGKPAPLPVSMSKKNSAAKKRTKETLHAKSSRSKKTK